MRKLLTEAMIEKQGAPKTGRLEIFDNIVPALALRVTATGAKSFVVRARIKGQATPIRVTLEIAGIREAALLKLKDVRESARDVLMKCKVGEDPRAPTVEPAEPVREVTLREAWDRYRDAHLVRKGRSEATIAGYRDHVERLMEAWLDLPLRTLGDQPEKVAKHHDTITADHGPYCANGSMRTLRAVYNHARKTARYLPADNPVNAVDWNPELRRDTAMGVEELPRWFGEADALLNPIRREFHLFCLLSGSRPGALMAAAIEHLDFKRRVLHLPKPKGGANRAFDIPLSRPMIRCIIRAIRASRALHPMQARTWIFASDGALGHIAEQKEKRTLLFAWGNDLRQTYRTLGQAAGLSEIDMHLLMNHSLKGSVNAGYITRSKLLEDHLRDAQARLSQFLLAASERAAPAWPLQPSRPCIEAAIDRGRRTQPEAGPELAEAA